MRRTRLAIVVTAMLSMVLVGAIYAEYTSYWKRGSEMLVYNDMYTALLVDPTPNSIAMAISVKEDVLEWTALQNGRQFQIGVVIKTMASSDGVIVINITEVPPFLDVNINSIDIWTIHYTYTPPNCWSVTSILNVAENVTLGLDTIEISRDDVLYGPLDDGYADKKAIIITLGTSVISFPDGLSEILEPTIELGIGWGQIP